MDDKLFIRLSAFAKELDVPLTDVVSLKFRAKVYTNSCLDEVLMVDKTDKRKTSDGPHDT
jgi:hypothetical protein